MNEDTVFEFGVVAVHVHTKDGARHIEDWAPRDAKEAKEYAQVTSDCHDVAFTEFRDSRKGKDLFFINGAPATFSIHGEDRYEPCMTLGELAALVARFKGQDIVILDHRRRGRDYKLFVADDGHAFDRFASRSRFDVELRLSRPGGC